MKKYILAIVVIFVMVSCSSSDSDDSLTMNQIEVDLESELSEEVTVMGDFVSDAHPTSGKTTVTNSTLNFQNFKTDDGPKLLVYLSTSVESTDFVNLGDLKGIEGNYTYNIPENTDLEKYKYVVIWCVDFLVSFGHAELK
ncbi:DM13 domain-containing protein [Lutibacter sp. TH_r2]|uniref:DM13 domain-containing protein n=1 Tax=Lutibacter sp. TH_r2 TaxID=3082083 RepID=UPI002954D330|nr:DM13 domain-containing protein [Lutibacter sp. TH_r2]MDV7187835.1 DM13 domain-containing protein [Lutibacter sp. TH_r2]